MTTSLLVLNMREVWINAFGLRSGQFFFVFFFVYARLPLKVSNKQISNVWKLVSSIFWAWKNVLIGFPMATVRCLSQRFYLFVGKMLFLTLRGSRLHFIWAKSKFALISVEGKYFISIGRQHTRTIPWSRNISVLTSCSTALHSSSIFTETEDRFLDVFCLTRNRQRGFRCL